MRKSLILAGMLSIGYAYAQEGRVGINTEDPKATLDIKSVTNDTAKGILIPQLTGDALKTMTSGLTADQHGLLTYATSGVTTADEATANVQFPGYHRFNIDGTTKSWVRMEPSGLQKLKSNGGNIGIGWRLIDKNTSEYAPIGAGAVDISVTMGDVINNGSSVYGASGNYSFASGRETKASAYGTIAMGTFSVASKIGAIAIGNSNTSSGDYAVSIGSGNTSSSYYTTAIGNSNKATINFATAIGNTNTASGYASVAMGYNNTAGARVATALGEANNVTAQYGLAVGKSNTVSAESAVALGNTNTATGVGSFASGLSSTASGYVAYALGRNNQATASYTFAFGSNTQATKYAAIAMGEDAKASGEYSLAIGRGTIATGWGNFAMGQYNTEPQNHTRAFVVGNGTHTDANGITRSDALTILNNGKVGIDIDNFETTTSDAKLQVNGKILSSSLASAGSGNRPVYADENGVLVIGTGSTATTTGATTLSGEKELPCNSSNRGKMNFVTSDTGSDVFGICMRNKDGNYYWAYMVGGNNPTNGTGAFGSGL